MGMSIDWLPFVLRTSDPLFPTGSYAHSFGFEEFVRLTDLSGEEALRTFLELHVLPALALQELPYLRFAHASSGASDFAGVAELDCEINAWKIPSELRCASIKLGARRLDILLKTAPTPVLSGIAARIASGEMAGHHITISGAQYATIPLEPALMTYFYQTLSSYCVAALKLLRIGQETCQRILAACLEMGPRILRDSLDVERPRAGCFNPLVEIASMRHETAFERLFIS
ncbi:MAG: urease accessory UreF family protein [Chthoniobacteraceae bacterium]|jgi:urease accessory protein